VVGVDAEGTIIFINDAARDMLGWAEGEGIGADLHALTHHHHADGRPFPADECPIAATMRDGQTRHVADDCYWRRDGAPLAVEYTVAALLQDGKPGGAVNVFRDISVRKQNEAELAAYRHDLESLVAERTLRSAMWRPGPATCWNPARQACSASTAVA
jgi:PAS domain S-box-containing protein